MRVMNEAHEHAYERVYLDDSVLFDCLRRL